MKAKSIFNSNFIFGKHLLFHNKKSQQNIIISWKKKIRVIIYIEIKIHRENNHDSSSCF